MILNQMLNGARPRPQPGRSHAGKCVHHDASKEPQSGRFSGPSAMRGLFLRQGKNADSVKCPPPTPPTLIFSMA